MEVWFGVGEDLLMKVEGFCKNRLKSHKISIRSIKHPMIVEIA